MDNEQNGLEQDIAGEESLVRELAFLFGNEIVDQARLVDIADLNMTDAMTTEIGIGIKQLKQMRNDPQAQKRWVDQQEPGTRLLLCLWIMDMGLLDKIQAKSYL